MPKNKFFLKTFSTIISFQHTINMSCTVKAYKINELAEIALRFIAGETCKHC